MRFADELDVAEAEVAQPAVDQLRRRARGCRTEITAVDERDREPRPRSLVRDSGADDARSDHEDVEPTLGELGEIPHNGFVHARLPVASVTSMRAYRAPKGRRRRACVIPRSSAASTLPA